MNWGGKETLANRLEPETNLKNQVIVVCVDETQSPDNVQIRLVRTSLFVPRDCIKLETFSETSLDKIPLRLWGQLGEEGFKPLSVDQQIRIESETQSLELPPINNVVPEDVFCLIGGDGRIFFRCEQGIEKLDWLINNVLRITLGTPLKVFASFQD